MDVDGGDASSTDINGETKPDPAKLSQLIKQDVMLTGATTCTQSPVSITMPGLATPTSSIPPVTIPNMTLGNSVLHGGAITDHLFAPGLVHNETSHVSEVLKDLPGAHNLTSQQIFSQSPVATPQFVMAGGAAPGTPTAIPVQQILIPVSTGNGTQQILSIPVSMAAGIGANGQIQLLTTSNGQIIATNLANLATGLISGNTPPLNVTLPTAQTRTTVTEDAISAASHAITTTPQQIAAPQAQVATQLPSIPQVITNAQGQILGFAPQMMASSLGGTATSTTPSTFLQPTTTTPTLNSLATTMEAPRQLLQTVQQAASSSVCVSQPSRTVHHTSSTTPQRPEPSGAYNLTIQKEAPSAVISWPHLPTSAVQLSQASQSHTVPSTQTASMTLAPPNQTIQQSAVTMATVSVSSTINSNSLVNSLPPNVSQLLPNTVSNSSESTTVDGINLDEIKEFAKQFKIRRLSLGLTQTQVGQALSATEGPAYSQSAICRFEKLDITPKSAQKIKPVLERWMREAEERYKNGMHNLTEFIGSEPSKKRKRRTSFTPQALEFLNEHFERNTHPSGAEMTELSERLNFDREVIRVWFCNKRQMLKNTIRRLKQAEIPTLCE
ncbi:unnamed protein product [Owenia fusiformis]|uniref:POU domain protein n=1 Tax=Owenia fusiformis TaxID=6347 RepID=A0A8J1UG53_OWEFU|nr:unnamed protein product [Owenia fusiformis]